MTYVVVGIQMSGINSRESARSFAEDKQAYSSVRNIFPISSQHANTIELGY